MSRVTLAPLSSADPAAVDALLDAAFGADRRGRTAYRLRAGTTAIDALSMAALDAGNALVGSIQCWPVTLVGADMCVPLVMVGPVAVAPDRQGGGIGRALMTRMLAVADRSDAGIPGAERLMMIGDPDYYGRFFGFSADATAGWQVPGPVERHRLLARAAPGRLPAIDGLIEPGRARVTA